MCEQMPSISKFKILFLITCLYLVFNWVTSVIVDANNKDRDKYKTTEDEDESVVIIAIIWDIVEFVFFIYTLVITIQTWQYICQKYQILTQCCGGCKGKKNF